ncbi:MAG TPA: LysM domain-containing protein [Planktothrix sp.]|jgi:hypothetical protein
MASTANRDVDTIVHDLKATKSGGDYSHVASEVQHLQKTDKNWQKDLASVHAKVNMKDLGFGDNFQITGVDNKGNFTSQSADGQTTQTRNAKTMNVESQHATPQDQKWGNKTFQVDPKDGSASYQVKPHDNLWGIAGDALQHQMGDKGKPTNEQINDMVNKIAKENKISNPNKIKPGEQIKIPAAKDTKPQAKPAEAQPSLSVDPQHAPEALQPKADSTNPLEPTGLAPEVPGTDDPSVYSKKVTDSKTNPDGSKTEKSQGVLNDSDFKKLGEYFGLGTHFTAEQTTSNDGKLIHNKVNYSGSGADLNIENGNGTHQTLNNVQSVENIFNPKTGQYDSQITTTDGATYAAHAGADGKLSGLQKTKDAPATDPANSVDFSAPIYDPAG